MKTALRWSFFVVAAVLMAWAVLVSWDSFVVALQRLDWQNVVGALAACVIALFLNAMSWRAVMRSVGLDATIAQSLRVFLLSQIGKYIPGSIWPVLAQSEFAAEHGVSRARAMTGSLVAMMVGVIMAGVVGAVGLAVSAPDALLEYWWVLLASAGLAALLIPAVLRRIVALVFRITKRPETPTAVGGAALLASALWSTAMWTVLGLQAWWLLLPLAPEASYPLAAGAFAMAWLVGFVVVFAPAGVGAREAALVLALSAVAGPAQALSLALVSRVLMTLADGIGFAVGVAVRKRRRSLPDPAGDAVP